MTLDTTLLLVIDDDAVDRKQVARWFGHVYAVCEAATARVGLDMARRLRPGCVLLDYRLTDADGLDVLEELLRADLSVVVLTGQGDEEVAVQALKAGATDYLVKDRVERESLAASIARAMERTSARRRAPEPGEDLDGFGHLAVATLRPGLSEVALACERALRMHADLGPVLGYARRRIGELGRQVDRLAFLAALDGLCARRERVDLAQVAERAAAAPDVDAVDVDVDVRGLPIVEGAPEALEALLRELVESAVRNARAAPAPAVRISSDLDGGTWRVRVEDSGPPPTEAELSREVFLPYRKGSGDDLGLALAAQIVRRHGGHAWIEAPDDGGRRVSFTLPFSRQPA